MSNGSMPDSKKYPIKEIFNRALKFHKDKKTDWDLVLSLVKQRRGATYNHFQETISQYVSILRDLKFNATFVSHDITEPEKLKQAQKVSQFTQQVIDRYEDSFTTALEDGIAINYGVIYLFVSENKVHIKRISPYKIAIYKLPNQKFFVVDIENRKLWTDDKIYFIETDKNNKEIIKTEPNILGFIPYCIYQPYRKEESEEKAAGFYGEPWWQLFNIQQRYNTNQEYAKNLTHAGINPPIIQKEGAKTLTPTDLDILYRGYGVIQTQDPINDYIIKQTTSERSLDILTRNENKILQEKRNLTALTELTQGSTTKNIAPTFFRENLEVAMRPMKAVERAYTNLYNDLARKIAKLHISLNQKAYTIDIDDLKLDTQQKKMDPTEIANFFQNFTITTQNFGMSSQVVALNKQVMTPILSNIINSISDNPIQDLLKIDNAFNALQEQQAKIDELKALENEATYKQLQLQVEQLKQQLNEIQTPNNPNNQGVIA